MYESLYLESISKSVYMNMDLYVTHELINNHYVYMYSRNTNVFVLRGFWRM